MADNIEIQDVCSFLGQWIAGPGDIWVVSGHIDKPILFRLDITLKTSLWKENVSMAQAPTKRRHGSFSIYFIDHLTRKIIQQHTRTHTHPYTLTQFHSFTLTHTPPQAWFRKKKKNGKSKKKKKLWGAKSTLVKLHGHPSRSAQPVPSGV
jgi:hypothetical protein